MAEEVQVVPWLLQGLAELLWTMIHCPFSWQKINFPVLERNLYIYMDFNKCFSKWKKSKLECKWYLLVEKLAVSMNIFDNPQLRSALMDNVVPLPGLSVLDSPLSLPGLSAGKGPSSEGWAWFYTQVLQVY